jgi:hypothetical protein
MSIYHNPPKPGDEVTLLAYVNTAINDFELSPGDTATVSRIDGDEIYLDVVYTSAHANSPYAGEHEDWFSVPYDEADEYFAGIIRIEE